MPAQRKTPPLPFVGCCYHPDRAPSSSSSEDDFAGWGDDDDNDGGDDDDDDEELDDDTDDDDDGNVYDWTVMDTEGEGDKKMDTKKNTAHVERQYTEKNRENSSRTAVKLT